MNDKSFIISFKTQKNTQISGDGGDDDDDDDNKTSIRLSSAWRRSESTLRQRSKTIEIDVPIDIPTTLADAQYRRTDNVWRCSESVYRQRVVDTNRRIRLNFINVHVKVYTGARSTTATAISFLHKIPVFRSLYYFYSVLQRSILLLFHHMTSYERLYVSTDYRYWPSVIRC